MKVWYKIYKNDKQFVVFSSEPTEFTNPEMLHSILSFFGQLATGLTESSKNLYEFTPTVIATSAPNGWIQMNYTSNEYDLEITLMN